MKFLSAPARVFAPLPSRWLSVQALQNSNSAEVLAGSEISAENPTETYDPKLETQRQNQHLETLGNSQESQQRLRSEVVDTALSHTELGVEMNHLQALVKSGGLSKSQNDQIEKFIRWNNHPVGGAILSMGAGGGSLMQWKETMVTQDENTGKKRLVTLWESVSSGWKTDGVWGGVSGFFSYFIARKFEDALLSLDQAEAFYGTVEDKVDGVTEMAQQAEETLDGATEAAKGVSSTLRENSVEIGMTAEMAKSAAGNAKGELDTNLKQAAQRILPLTGGGNNRGARGNQRNSRVSLSGGGNRRGARGPLRNKINAARARLQGAVEAISPKRNPEVATAPKVETTNRRPTLSPREIWSQLQTEARALKELKSPEGLKTYAQGVNRLYEKNPVAVAGFARKGMIPGFSLKKYGGIMALRLTIDNLILAARSGNFSEYFSAGKSQIIQNVMEAVIPIYGSVKSSQRLDQATTTAERIAGRIELGINLVADAAMIIGVGTAWIGGAGVPVIAAGAGLRTGSKSIASGIAKKITGWFGKKSTQESVEQGTQQAAKTTAQTTGKTTAETTGTTATKGERTKAFGRLVANEGKWQLGLFGSEIAFRKVMEAAFPNGVVEEIKSEALSHIGPEQQRTLDLVNQIHQQETVSRLGADSGP